MVSVVPCVVRSGSFFWRMIRAAIRAVAGWRCRRCCADDGRGYPSSCFKPNHSSSRSWKGFLISSRFISRSTSKSSFHFTASAKGVARPIFCPPLPS